MGEVDFGEAGVQFRHISGQVGVALDLGIEDGGRSIRVCKGAVGTVVVAVQVIANGGTQVAWFTLVVDFQHINHGPTAMLAPVAGN
jgi:hypothetical protein